MGDRAKGVGRTRGKSSPPPSPQRPDWRPLGMQRRIKRPHIPGRACIRGSWTPSEGELQPTIKENNSACSRVVGRHGEDRFPGERNSQCKHGGHTSREAGLPSGPTTRGRGSFSGRVSLAFCAGSRPFAPPLFTTIKKGTNTKEYSKDNYSANDSSEINDRAI